MNKINDAFEKEREFTSNASHELMTPISILQTKMENLLDERDTDEALQHTVQGMMKTLKRLKKIVHSLLLISRIENDQFPKNDALSPYLLVTEVMEELSHRLEEKNLRFSMQLSPQTMLHRLNHDLIFQLVYNLLQNAVKYNRENGSITVTDEIHPDHYLLIISDTGIGISSREVDTIFHRFRKIQRGTAEGYGLGLAIAHTIAQYHHIQISVETTMDQGSTFTLRFPL
nr:HAMP domain-containing sensor histidine kinase [Chitinophaga varians]